MDWGFHKSAAPSSIPASANPFAGIKFVTPTVASTEAESGGKMAPEKVEEKIDTSLENNEDGRKIQSDALEAKQEPIGEGKETLNQSTESKSTYAEIIECSLVVEKDNRFQRPKSPPRVTNCRSRLFHHY